MNRLSPLIVRRVGPRAAAAAMTAAAWNDDAEAEAQASRNYEDLKLFATGWLGGLIFFGTFFS